MVVRISAGNNSDEGAYWELDEVGELKGLCIVHIHVRSLLPKIDANREFVRHVKLHVLCISETWLNKDITDGMVGIEDFVLYRNDRKGKRGGGTGIYVKNNIQVEIDPNLYSSEKDHSGTMMLKNLPII